MVGAVVIQAALRSAACDSSKSLENRVRPFRGIAEPRVGKPLEKGNSQRIAGVLADLRGDISSRRASK